MIKKYARFIKFCIVGGSGALITFGITYLLTEYYHLWYILSMVIAVAIATVWNYNFNLLWTFKVLVDFRSPGYEWESFYNGNPIQKWWKQSIAKTVWEWIPSNETLLDVGCGSSPIISKYSKATGIDTNYDKLKFMQTKLKDLQFYGFIPFKPETYENVICIEVLEHLNNPEELIKEISARVIKKVVIATPDYKKPMWSIAEKFTPYKEDHKTKLNRELLESICLKYNLHPVKFRYIAGCDLVELFEKR
jgi:hypothetical protein